MEGQFKDIINNFLKYNAVWIALAVVGIIVITALLLIIFNRRTNKKKETKVTISSDDDEWLNALGGQDNIKDVSAKGSRLTLSLVDEKKIDDEKLKVLGVQSILKMSNKIILVVEKQAQLLLEKINKK